MAIRMMCTRCLETAEPDTLIEGSDLLELLGWCCFLIPGLLYCHWRNALQAKICPQCGCGVLVRESRVARARQAHDPPAPRQRQIHYRIKGPRLPWPRSLATPQQRLRLGAQGSSLVFVLVAGWAFASMNTVRYEPVRLPAVPEARVASATPEVPGNSSVSESLDRQRRCWQRCNAFHNDDPTRVRECVSACVAEQDRKQANEALQGDCGGLMDADSCEAFLGE